MNPIHCGHKDLRTKRFRAGGTAGAAAMMTALVCLAVLAPRAQEAPPAPPVSTPIDIGPPPQVVRGTILGAKDQYAVAGATVLLEVSDMSTRRPILKTRARTDNDGRFEADLSSVKAEWIGIQFNAWSPHHAEALKIEIIEKKSLPFEITIELQPGFCISGHVYDPKGKPLPGASVEVPYSRPVISEFDGFYSLEGIPLYGRTQVTASAAGYSTEVQTVSNSSTDGVTGVDFHLRGSRSLEGTVTDTKGDPISGATVILSVSLGSQSRTTTDTGRFVFEDLPFGEQKIYIQVRHPEYSLVEIERELGDEAPPPLEIKMQRAAALEGRVVDGQGRPVSGAEVALSLPDLIPRTLDTTDLDGRFKIKSLPLGELVLTVSPPGNSALERTGELLLQQSGKRLKGDVDPWPDGNASDYEGSYSADGIIMLVRKDRKSASSLYGSKEMAEDAGVEKSQEKKLEKQEKNLGRDAQATSTPASTSTRPPVAAEYTGRVSANGLRAMGRLKGLVPGAASGSWEAQRENGSRDSLDGIWIMKESLSPPEVALAPARQRITTREGETLREEITLRPGWTLNGRTLDSTDAPIANARVRLASWKKSPAPKFETRSDANGNFVFSGLPEGEITVVAYEPSWGGASRAFSAPPEKSDKPEVFVLNRSASGSGSDRTGGSAGAAAAESPFEAGPKEGDAALDFSAKLLDGGEVSMAGMKGKVVILDFWASWCGPCAAEMPSVRRVYSKYKDRSDFALIGVSLDSEESDVRGAMKRLGITWPQVFDGQGWDTPMAQKYKVMAIPRAFIIGRDGKIAARDLRGEELLNAVQKLLDGN